MLDLLLFNARIADVLRLRLFDGWLGIADGHFVYVEAGSPPPDLQAKTVRDRAHMVIAPGLIDSHMHIESSLITPRRFAEAVLPWGTTTILSDPHEVGNVAGERGVRWMIEASASLPLRVFHSIPSCVPATSPEIEWTGEVFTAETITRLAGLPSVIALGEVMDYRGLLGASDRLIAIVQAARDTGLLIEGHIPTLKGSELSAYLTHGVSSDHTLTTPAKIEEQISKGAAVMLQTKSLTPENIAAVLALPDRSRLILVTDDIEPPLLERGHLSRMVELAVSAGLPPLEALACATIRPARYLERRYLGAVAPGYHADFMLLDDLNVFPPREVYAAGQQVVRVGVYSGAPMPELPDLPDYPSVPGPFTPDSFRLTEQAGHTRIQANVVALQDQRTTLTRLETAEFRLVDDVPQFEPDDDFAIATIFTRGGGHSSSGIIRGTGIRSGAFASTVAHDCHNLLVIGRDPVAMTDAANAVYEMGGGVAVAHGGRVTAQVSLPYFGLMSDAPAAEVAAGMTEVERQLAEIGCKLQRPFLTLSIMSLSVSPFYKFTDRGVVDSERRALLPAWEAVE